MDKGDKQLIGGTGVAVVVLLLLIFGSMAGCAGCAGDGSWGFGAEPYVVEATVLSKHVDISGDSQSSHYMVTTDKGTFEIDNGMIMWLWNADELYGKLEVGKVYKFTVQGDTTASWWYQAYPYVQNVEPRGD